MRKPWKPSKTFLLLEWSIHMCTLFQIQNVSVSVYNLSSKSNNLLLRYNVFLANVAILYIFNISKHLVPVRRVMHTFHDLINYGCTFFFLLRIQIHLEINPRFIYFLLFAHQHKVKYLNRSAVHSSVFSYIIVMYATINVWLACLMHSATTLCNHNQANYVVLCVQKYISDHK